MTVSGVNGSNPYSVEADFTFSTDTLTLVLKNLVTDQTTSGVDLSGISWTMAGGSFANNIGSGANLTTTERSAIQQGVVNGWTDAAYNSGDILWNFTNTGLNFDLTTIGNPAAQYMIVGAPGSNGAYNNANASIGKHDPELAATATFTLIIPGVTDQSLIATQGLTFAFGGGPDFTAQTLVCGDCLAAPASTPEPVTIGLTGAGLLLAGLFRRKLRACTNS
jgi:hypothetical protein